MKKLQAISLSVALSAGLLTSATLFAADTSKAPLPLSATPGQGDAGSVPLLLAAQYAPEGCNPAAPQLVTTICSALLPRGGRDMPARVHPTAGGTVKTQAGLALGVVF